MILGNVSRETLEDLKKYETLVQKWSSTINLVSKKDLPDVFQRHIADSIDVFEVAKQLSWNNWLDVGSGGGFPAIVAATCAKNQWPAGSFVLVESDQRKCAFLRSVATELNLNVEVEAARIEDLAHSDVDIISARALASLTDLLALTFRFSTSQTTFIFPKGKNWESEVETAKQMWHFDLEAHQSRTNSASMILELTNVSKR